MPAITMKKMSFVGLLSDRHHILDQLMRMGIAQIDQIQTQNDQDNTRDEYNERISKLLEKMQRVKRAIDALSVYEPIKRGLFTTRKTIDDSEYETVCQNDRTLLQLTDNILSLQAGIDSKKSAINRLHMQKQTLLPWESYPLAFETTQTKRTCVIKGTLPAMISMDDVEKKIDEKSEYAALYRISQDKEQHYIAFICIKEEEKTLVSVLKRYGFSEFHDESFTGSVADEIQNINDRLDEQQHAIELDERNIRSHTDEYFSLTVYYDSLKMEKNKLEAMEKMLDTQSAFYFEAWLPERAAESVKTRLTKKFDCHIVTQAPGDDESCPVLLKNGPIGESVEMITEMYSLPSTKEADPNAIMAPFFFLFFGLMLGDAGYGLLLFGFSAFVLWKFELERSVKRFMKMLMFCGAATVFWGVLFGGWFGDLLSMLIGNPSNDVALWFNPVDDPEYLLMWSLAFGVIHMFIGIGIKGYNYIKQKKVALAIFDSLFWYVLFTGMVMALMPFVPTIDEDFGNRVSNIGQNVFFIGIGLIILSGLYGTKGIKSFFIGFFKGVAKLYDLIGFLSDVLSYSRLLALGLATTVIATIVNQMAVMAGFNILGVIVFILVFVLGHTLNIALNSLSAYVHASRLQYIEFFGKFYQGGGKAFEPFTMDTEYIKLK